MIKILDDKRVAVLSGQLAVGVIQVPLLDIPVTLSISQTKEILKPNTTITPDMVDEEAPEIRITFCTSTACESFIKMISIIGNNLKEKGL